MQQPVRKYFAHRPRRDPGIGVKIQLFQNIVMLHIKSERSRMQQHCSKYFALRPPHTAPDPGDGVSRSKLNFSVKFKRITNVATGSQIF